MRPEYSEYETRPSVEYLWTMRLEDVKENEINLLRLGIHRTIRSISTTPCHSCGMDDVPTGEVFMQFRHLCRYCAELENLSEHISSYQRKVKIKKLDRAITITLIPILLFFATLIILSILGVL